MPVVIHGLHFKALKNLFSLGWLPDNNTLINNNIQSLQSLCYSVFKNKNQSRQQIIAECIQEKYPYVLFLTGWTQQLQVANEQTEDLSLIQAQEELWIQSYWNGHFFAMTQNYYLTIITNYYYYFDHYLLEQSCLSWTHLQAQCLFQKYNNVMSYSAYCRWKSESICCQHQHTVSCSTSFLFLAMNTSLPN